MTASQPAAPKAAPVRSMTGFARVRQATANAEVVVSVKSVNHRALDVHFHCSTELDPLENEMRALIRRALVRGHIEVRASVAYNAAAPQLALNRRLLAAYIAAFRAAAEEYGLRSEPDLNAALRIPGVLGEPPEQELDPEIQSAVLTALRDALDALNQFREREAAEIVAGMLAHNQALREAASELSAIRDRALPLLQARLSERLRELLRGAIDPQRLAQEVAMLADRSDITEEIARLQIHCAQLAELLSGGGEVGKKLDFLLQEMNRETNTILSKTTGVGEIGLRITELALQAKANIEKIREQSLNLE
jgi:uncharacterized protein (TIGR00255 family)